VGKKVSIVFSMPIAFLVFGGIMYFISPQVVSFRKSLPLLKDKMK
jgi:hypothetical protein